MFVNRIRKVEGLHRNEKYREAEIWKEDYSNAYKVVAYRREKDLKDTLASGWWEPKSDSESQVLINNKTYMINIKLKSGKN